MASRALNPTEFTTAVSAVTAAFGDPTRRRIYLLVREQADGLTVADVAEATGLHANVARHHLEKLAAGGHLDVGQRQTAGAGRPARIYRTTGAELTIGLGIGRDDVLVTLLGKALSRLPAQEAAELAEEAGIELGRRLAAAMGHRTDGGRSLRAAVRLTAEALSANGFAASAEEGGAGGVGSLRVVAGHCPFGDVALEHPVICAVDRGLVSGLLGSLHGSAGVVGATSVARGDRAYATAVAEPRSEVPVGFPDESG